MAAGPGGDARPAPAGADTVGVFRDRGLLALDQRRYADAAQSLQRVLAAAPDDDEAKLALGDAYLGLNRLDSALAGFEPLVSNGTPAVRARALQGVGIARLRQGDTAGATALLRDAVAADASLWRSWNALGHLYDGRREWEQAREAFGAALRIRPDEALVYNNLGMSLLASGRPAEALEAFDTALRLAPDLQVAEANIRIALAWQGRYGEALKGMTRDEVATVLNNVGYIATLRADYPEAEKYLHQAVAASVSHFDTAQKNIDYLEQVKRGIDAGPDGMR